MPQRWTARGAGGASRVLWACLARPAPRAPREARCAGVLLMCARARQACKSDGSAGAATRARLAAIPRPWRRIYLRGSRGSWPQLRTARPWSALRWPREGTEPLRWQRRPTRRGEAQRCAPAQRRLTTQRGRAGRAGGALGPPCERRCGLVGRAEGHPQTPTCKACALLILLPQRGLQAGRLAVSLRACCCSSIRAPLPLHWTADADCEHMVH